MGREEFVFRFWPRPQHLDVCWCTPIVGGLSCCPGPCRSVALLRGAGLDPSIYHGRVLSFLPAQTIKQIHKGEVAFLLGPCTSSPWSPRTVLFLLGHSRHLDGHMTPWVLGEVISLFSVSGTHLPSQLPGLC